MQKIMSNLSSNLWRRNNTPIILARALQYMFVDVNKQINTDIGTRSYMNAVEHTQEQAGPYPLPCALSLVVHWYTHCTRRGVRRCGSFEEDHKLSWEAVSVSIHNLPPVSTQPPITCETMDLWLATLQDSSTTATNRVHFSSVWNTHIESCRVTGS